MKIAALTAFALAIVFALPAAVSATGPTNGNFGGNGGAFVNDYDDHYVNANNPEVRFDWENHRMAVPGKAYMHANENAAVMDNGGYTLVDPHDTL